MSDPYFSLPDKPPVEAGLFPFHARGSLFQRDFACHRASMTSTQLAQAVRMLPDPSFERYVSQTFLASELYDLLPLEYLRAAVARVRNVPPSRVIRDAIVYMHQHSLGGVTGIMLKDLTPEVVASWLTRVSASVYDFGRLEVTPVGPGRLRCVRTGVPRILVRPWSTAVSEFISVSLAHVGAVHPHVAFLGPEPHGLDHGYEVFRVNYEVEWR